MENTQPTSSEPIFLTQADSQPPSPTPQKNNPKTLLLILGGLVLLSASGVGGYYLGTTNSQKVNITGKTSPMPSPVMENVACTMEAKLCSDGSSVGRSGPNCEFAECPTPITSPSPSPSPKSLMKTSPIGESVCPFFFYAEFAVSNNTVSPAVSIGTEAVRTEKMVDLYVRNSEGERVFLTTITIPSGKTTSSGRISVPNGSTNLALKGCSGWQEVDLVW